MCYYTLQYAVVPRHHDELLLVGTHDQHTLRWGRLFYGIWSKFWIQLQQQHLQSLGSKKSAEIWLATLQQKLWLLAFDMWDHHNKVLHDTPVKSLFIYNCITDSLVPHLGLGPGYVRRV